MEGDATTSLFLKARTVLFPNLKELKDADLIFKTGPEILAFMAADQEGKMVTEVYKKFGDTFLSKKYQYSAQRRALECFVEFRELSMNIDKGENYFPSIKEYYQGFPKITGDFDKLLDAFLSDDPDRFSEAIYSLFDETNILVRYLTPIYFCNYLEKADFTTLNTYCDIGNKLRADSNFHESPLGSLNEFVKDPEGFVKANFQLPKQETSLKKVFAGLVAPAFEGKTQSAFVIDSKPVLFFNMCHKYFFEAEKPINQCFQNHSRCLSEIAENDFEKARDAYNSNRQEIRAGNFEVIEAFPLKILGFIAAILEKTRKQQQKLEAEQSKSVHWLEAYSKVEILVFRPMLIKEFREKSLDFCVFIDDYNREYGSWFNFFRNLVRYVGGSVIVASSTSDAIEFYDKDNMKYCGLDKSLSSDRLQGWALVFNNLGKTDRSLLPMTINQTESIDELVARLKKKCANVSDFEALFDRIFKESFDATRPGIAGIVAEKIAMLLESFPDANQLLPLSEILQFLFKNVKDELLTRKPSLTKGQYAHVAKINFLLPRGYSETGADFIDQHLFLLKYPSKLKDEHPKKCFLTLAPYPLSEDINLSNGMTWNGMTTQFRLDEFFVLMPCLNVEFSLSTTRRLEYCFKSIAVSSFSIFNSPRPGPPKAQGTNLEVTANVAACDSSHYDYASLAYGLSGQPAQSFFSNLIRNWFIARINARELPLISFSAGLASWLSSAITMPFLFGIDLNLTGSVIEDLISAPASTGLFIRPLSSCPDTLMIDGIFPFKEGDEEMTCVLECRNNYNFTVSDLECSLRKIFRVTTTKRQRKRRKVNVSHREPRLILLHCRKVDAGKNQSRLQKYCTEERINLYRVQVGKADSFSVTPFVDECEGEAACIAIIFEYARVENDKTLCLN